MRVRVKGFREENVERILHALMDLGVDTGNAYSNLTRGRLEFEVEIKEEDLPKLSHALEGLCTLEVINQEQKAGLLAYLVGFFLDILLVYQVLNLSVYSDRLKYFLSILFGGRSIPGYLFNLFALLFIVAYFYSFLRTKKAPPVSSYMGLRFDKSQNLALFAYSGVLPSFYLMSQERTLIRLLGFLLFCLCLAIYIEVKRDQK